jgi:hypothetical protein
MDLCCPIFGPHDGTCSQLEHSLREVFHGLWWIVLAGAAWRLMPPDLPPWHTVYQQSHRWLKAGWCMICARCCGWRRDGTRNPRPPSSIATPCSRRPKVAPGRAMTRPNAAGARKCIWPLTPWGICWPSTSPRPAYRIGAKCLSWLNKCKRSRAMRSRSPLSTMGISHPGCSGLPPATRSGETARSQKRLCVVAQALGSEAQ